MALDEVSNGLILDMRTCAAAMLDHSGNAHTPFQRMYRDAAKLLIEASNRLDVPEPLGEPMEDLAEQAGKEAYSGGAVWTTGTRDLPTATAKPCPNCSSIDARKVRIDGRRLMLTCPMCSCEWEYKP